jgi:hypothetical protein
VEFPRNKWEKPKEILKSFPGMETEFDSLAGSERNHEPSDYYEGSRMFSSFAQWCGLSVDLVSFAPTHQFIYPKFAIFKWMENSWKFYNIRFYLWKFFRLCNSMKIQRKNVLKSDPIKLFSAFLNWTIII